MQHGDEAHECVMDYIYDRNVHDCQIHGDDDAMMLREVLTLDECEVPETLGRMLLFTENTTYKVGKSASPPHASTKCVSWTTMILLDAVHGVHRKYCVCTVIAICELFSGNVTDLTFGVQSFLLNRDGRSCLPCQTHTTHHMLSALQSGQCCCYPRHN